MTGAGTAGDRVVALLFVLVLVLLFAGLTGAHQLFGYAIVAWLSVLAGIGFVRSRQPATWIAAILVFIFLLIGMTGILLNESAVVAGVADTVLGFHPATAYLVYLIWVPGFFTLGCAFVLLFNRLGDES